MGALLGLPHNRRRRPADAGAAVTALTSALSCRSCRPNAPFAELVCLWKASLAEGVLLRAQRLQVDYRVTDRTADKLLS